MKFSFNRKIEGFSVDRYLDRTWNEFQLKTFPVDSLKILWRSFDTPEELTDRYFNALGQDHLLEEGADLTRQDEELIEETDWYAKQIHEYREWARDAGGDPLFREEIVRYCSAFENALKRVALAFLVISRHENASHLNIDADAMNKYRRLVRESWDKSNQPKVENFFIQNVLECNPDVDRWPWQAPNEALDEDIFSNRDMWACVNEAFLLRNKIIHEDGFISSEVLNFGDIRLEPKTEAVVTMKLARRIHGSMTNLMSPLGLGKR